MVTEADCEFWKEEDFVPYVQVKYVLIRLGRNVSLTHQNMLYIDSRSKQKQARELGD